MTGQGKSAIDTLLAESFKELAKKHPIEKITIKEITDLAGVIRPTFYTVRCRVALRLPGLRLSDVVGRVRQICSIRSNR